MSTLLRARRPFAQSQIAAGEDTVIAGVWVPSGSIITRVRGEVSLTGPSELLLGQVVSYGLEGWVLPKEDPDSGETMNAVWDRFVPKDTGAFVLDLDTGASDSAPFYEPGLIAWEFLYDMGTEARRILHRHRMLSAANGSIGFRQDEETPFLEHWFPGRVERVDVARPIRVNGPSLVVFAVGAPLTTSTSATTPVAGFSEEDWGRIKFIDEVLENAMRHLLGLTEAGAETPWVDAATLLKEYLDPLVLEGNAATLQPKSWLASGELTFDIVVPGRMKTGILTGGR